MGVRIDFDRTPVEAREMSKTHSAVIALLALLTPGASAIAQTCPDPDSLTQGIRPPLDVVRYLADDALEGRLAGSAGERCAGAYIARTFEQIGLEPGGENGTYFQALKLESTLNQHLSGGTGRNVIGILTGSDPQLREEAIIVGAHYDHLGMGGHGSLAPGEAAVHNGADDNASGVAALIATARELERAQRPRRSIVFVAFTGEEVGLLGSAHFAARGNIPHASMKAMLNMDMVGRLGNGPLIVYGVDTAEEWRALVERAAQDAGITVAMRGEGYGPSDHTSFYARDVPVLHFFTNVHGDYHAPGDDWQKIDADGLAKIVRMVTSITAEVASRPANLVLVRGAGNPPAQAGEGQARGYGTYLGSVPDFTPVERGVLLSGVSPRSPAARAGLRAGDVILGLGEHDVADLQGLTDALRAHEPGDTVEVRFLRDGRSQRVTVTLSRR
jgi:hypothetical protein